MAFFFFYLAYLKPHTPERGRNKLQQGTSAEGLKHPIVAIRFPVSTRYHIIANLCKLLHAGVKSSLLKIYIIWIMYFNQMLQYYLILYYGRKFRLSTENCASITDAAAESDWENPELNQLRQSYHYSGRNPRTES